MIAILSALAVGAVTQRPFGPFPQGSIRTDDTKIEHRDANGNVEGTEFVHFEFKVSVTLVQHDPNPSLATAEVVCTNDCNGKKHPDHSKCDLSCDTPCKKDHKITLTGKYEPDQNEMDRLTKESAKLSRAATSAAGPVDWSSAYSNILRTIRQSAESSKMTLTPQHIKTPCSSVERLYGRVQYDVVVDGEYRKVGFYMSKGQREPIDAQVGKLGGVVGRAYLPWAQPLWTSEPWVLCACKFVPTPRPDEPPGTPKEFIHKCTPTYSGLGWRKPDGTVVIPEGKNIHIDCHGKSLTRAEVDVKCDGGEEYHVCVPPGTLLVPKDGATQVMVNLEEQEAMCEIGPGWLDTYSHGPFVMNAAHMELSVACTELMKHQPTGATTFEIKPPNDDKLTQLATMFGRTNFHFGGLDQTRIWIYKDHASFEAINERMIPGVAEGKYLEALYDVGQAGADLDDAAFKPCHRVDLLAGPTANREATIWAIGWWASHDKRALLKQVDSMIKALSKSDSDNQTARHIADIAAGLSQSSEPDVQQSAARWLAAVPNGLQARVVEYGGFAYFADCLGSGADAPTLAALDVVSNYNVKAFKDQALALAGWGATPKIRARAAEVAAKL